MAKPRVGAVQDTLIGSVDRQKKEQIRVTFHRISWWTVFPLSESLLR